jgi:hypothetical protein
MNTFLVCTSIIFGLLRIFGLKTKSFQAFAHLWVGYLAGIYWAVFHLEDIQFIVDTRMLLWNIVALSVVELACFLRSKFLGSADEEA